MTITMSKKDETLMNDKDFYDIVTKKLKEAIDNEEPIVILTGSFKNFNMARTGSNSQALALMTCFDFWLLEQVGHKITEENMKDLAASKMFEYHRETGSPKTREFMENALNQIKAEVIKNQTTSQMDDSSTPSTK